MKQLHGQTSKFKTWIVIMRANNKEINVKNKQLITDLMLNQHFSPDKIWNKGKQNYITMLFSRWEIYYIPWMIATL